MGWLTVDLLFNELSVHGQFPDVATFKVSIDRVMNIRSVIRRFGLNLYCHRNVANRQVTPDRTMPQVIGALDRDSRRALMGWLTRHGPFWEDVREHSEDEYLEYKEKIVTDSAVGEAAYNRFHGIDQSVVSMDPSDWVSSPLTVTWVRDGQAPQVDVPNFLECRCAENRSRSGFRPDHVLAGSGTDGAYPLPRPDVFAGQFCTAQRTSVPRGRRRTPLRPPSRPSRSAELFRRTRRTYC